jgi:hypothetical protein
MVKASALLKASFAPLDLAHFEMRDGNSFAAWICLFMCWLVASLHLLDTPVDALDRQ